MAYLKVKNIKENRIAFLNTDHIIAMMPYKDYTDLILRDSIKCRVKETPEELLTIMKIAEVK